MTSGFAVDPLGRANRVMTPAGVIRRTADGLVTVPRLPVQRFPSGPTTMFPSVPGTDGVNSVITALDGGVLPGLSRPILFAPTSTNQMFPSGPATIDSGSEPLARAPPVSVQRPLSSSATSGVLEDWAIVTQALPLASTATPPGLWMSPPGSVGDWVTVWLDSVSSPTADCSVNHSMFARPGEITVGP